MFRSTNDVRHLKHSILYHKATTTNLFDPTDFVEGFVTCLIDDKGYPLLLCFITPYRDGLSRWRNV